MIKFIVTTPKEPTKVFDTFYDVMTYIHEIQTDKYPSQFVSFFGRPYNVDFETEETIPLPWTVDSVIFRDFDRTSINPSRDYVKYKIERIDFSNGTPIDFDQKS